MADGRLSFGFFLGIWLTTVVHSNLGSAQSMSVVTTRLNGSPFEPADLRTEFFSGEAMSINIVLDTRDTTIRTDAVSVGMRYPRGSLRKMVRNDGTSAGTGWPVRDGVVSIFDRSDLPDRMQAFLGSPFVTVTGSRENAACPCDEDNGVGMDAVVHFLLVDLQRQTFLRPSLYNLFQTDWVVARNCSQQDFEVEITNGPANGLRALGDPVENFLRDETSGIVYDIGEDGRITPVGSTVTALCPDGLAFLRGDANSDGRFDVSDALTILSGLFLGQFFNCDLAGDVDDNDILEITDAIVVLRFLFLSGDPVPPPFPDCGLSPTPNKLSCAIPCLPEES